MVLGNLANKVIAGIIGLVVVFILVANLYPTLSDAGSNLSTSGIPLGNLFVSGGIVTVLLAVGILLFAIRAAQLKK